MNCSESNLRVADPLYLSARDNNWLYLLLSNLRNNQIGALSVITVTQIAFVIKYVIINFGSTSTIRTGMENEKLSKRKMDERNLCLPSVRYNVFFKPTSLMLS